MLTPTIPGREWFLAENRASVYNQSRWCHEHLTLLDDEKQGCAKTMNALASSSTADWLLPLADDDLLLPRCLELLLSVCEGAHVIYPRPLVWGEDEAQFCHTPPNIPAVALISREFWELLGGYDLNLAVTEDRDFWCRAEQRSAVFRRYDDHPTWIYRFWGGNKSR